MRSSSGHTKCHSDDSGVDAVIESNDLFLRGPNVYRDRPDNCYSLADCMVKELCSERAIVDDHECIREGFRALLREEPA